MTAEPLSGEQRKAGWMRVCDFVLESVCLSLSLSSELTRGSLIRLQQSNNGRVALGTFNELLQRQSTCEAEARKRFTVSSSGTCDGGVNHAATTHQNHQKSF